MNNHTPASIIRWMKNNSIPLRYQVSIFPMLEISSYPLALKEERRVGASSRVKDRCNVIRSRVV